MGENWSIHEYLSGGLFNRVFVLSGLEHNIHVELRINVHAAYKVPLFLLTYQERSIGDGVG